MIEGERFSQVYLDKGKPVNDSQRMRNRIAAYYSDSSAIQNEHIIIKTIEQETGAEVPLRPLTLRLKNFSKSVKFVIFLIQSL